MLVVCVDGQFPLQATEWGDHFPAQDKIYTIRRVGRCPDITGKIGTCLQLEGITNPGDRLAFSAWRFRPLAEVYLEASQNQKQADKDSRAAKA